MNHLKFRRGAGLALAAAVVLLASCGHRQADRQTEPAAPAPAADAPPPAIQQPRPSVGGSAAASVDEYKREFATRLHQAASTQVFQGPPPNLLRSVIVMSVVLDGAGNLVDARILRDNGDPVTVRNALDSVRRAAPYARPASGLLRRGRLEFTETWLFQDDGRFQLRTLAEAWQQ